MPRKGGLDTEAIRRMMVEKGMTITEVAAALRKEYSTIWKHARDHGIAFKSRPKQPAPKPIDPNRPSIATLRLAQFDPCVQRAVRVRMGEDLKLPNDRDFGFGPAFYARFKAAQRAKKKSEGKSALPPPSEVP